MPRGGARAGAGRPKGQGKFGEKTRPIRIPISKIDSVMNFVNNSNISLPLYSSKVPAGFPSPADDHMEGKLDLNTHLVKHPTATFFVKASGDSMLGAGIHDGDILVVDRSLEPRKGKVVIAAVDGQLTVKRLQKKGSKTFLVFGYGSDQDLKTDTTAEPSNIWGQMHGKPYVSDTSYDPSKHLSSGYFGVAPSNTTLTITYRYNENSNANAAAGTVNQVVGFELDFKNEPSLDAEKLEYMRTSLQTYNEEPINGDISVPTTEEIRRRGMGVYATQKRAVTMQDYVSSTYSMPPTFGAVKRCAVLRDTNDLKRNINMYVIAESAGGKLEKASTQLKENVRTYLNKVRMISDSVDIFDATLINLGLEFDVTPKSGVSMKSLSIDLRKMLYSELTTIPPDIGEHFYLSEIFALLQNHPDVLTVNNVKVKCISGAGYSDVFYNVEENISPGKKFVYIPADFVWEIKNESDIKSRQ